MAKLMTVTFNQLGEGTIECKGYNKFRCLGRKGQKYKKDITVDPVTDPSIKSPIYYSRTYTCGETDSAGNESPCTMPWAIRLDGREGIYIHEWPLRATYAGNGGPTHGCIHLEIGDAKKVYDWVNGRTRIVMTYPWPSR
jgi:lipoprotein-anchoring transpeptidase ErfK/SrfK